MPIANIPENREPLAVNVEARLREALEKAREVLALSDGEGRRARAIKAPEDQSIAALCEQVGYGATMDAAARLWFLKDPVGAHTTGAAAITVRNTIALIDAALAMPQEAGGERAVYEACAKIAETLDWKTAGLDWDEGLSQSEIGEAYAAAIRAAAPSPPEREPPVEGRITPEIMAWAESVFDAEAAAEREPEKMGEGWQVAHELREEIVLAIAFLARDAGTNRLDGTVANLIHRLSEADVKARAALPAPPTEATPQKPAEPNFRDLVRRYLGLRLSEKRDIAKALGIYEPDRVGSDVERNMAEMRRARDEGKLHELLAAINALSPSTPQKRAEGGVL